MRYIRNELSVSFFLVLFQLVWRSKLCLCFQTRQRLDRVAFTLDSATPGPSDPSQCPSWTTAILRISYDGTRFTGWSAANDSETNQAQQAKPSKRRRRRNAGDDSLPRGFVRSVEGVLRTNLAKIYGNVDPQRIIVEGCSRTDRGVHATGMIAQIYCLKPNVLKRIEQGCSAMNDTDNLEMISSIPGKRLPHPSSSHDESFFEPLPMDGNLSRLAFALNRMRPSDIQITGIAPVPVMSSFSSLPFHPTLSNLSKRYEYKIAVGAFQDPTKARTTWYVGDNLNIAKVERGCKMLMGTHNFSAFQGVPRGPEERKRYRMDASNPTTSRCTLMRLDLEKESAPSEVYFPGVSSPIYSYKVIIEGDRFLYKMVRFLVGALVAVGTGKLNCEDLERALQFGTWEIPDEEGRRKEFECAPAHGLVLAKVDFGPLEIEWQPLRY